MKNGSSNNMLRSALALISAVLLLSCSNEKRETLTSGSLTMMTAEDLFPVIGIQADDFQRMYEEVHITNTSVSAREAFVALLTDSVRLIVSPRSLNEEERAAALKGEMEIDSVHIAYDGIAVIVNDKNTLTRITTGELRQLLTGEIAQWARVKGSGLSSTVVAAMGDPNSGVYEYVKRTVVPDAPFTSNLMPCRTTKEVMDLVKEHPNTIGFIGTAWLKSMPAGLHALEIGDPRFKRDSTATEMEYFQPHQAYIYQKLYPLSRTVTIYAKNVGKGPGLGFMSFAASAAGQKIIVSNGLVPATMPVRLVQLSTP